MSKEASGANSPTRMAITLGEQILRLLEASGASQIEQHVAIQIAQQLIPLSSARLVPEPEDTEVQG